MKKEGGWKGHHLIGIADVHAEIDVFANKNCIPPIETGVRWAVLFLSQDEDSTDIIEISACISLKQELSNGTTVNPPLFSLVYTFNDWKKDKRVSVECKVQSAEWEYTVESKYLYLRVCRLFN